MSEELQNNQEYGADQIQILEGLEAVRKRPGMYIGSTSSRGLHHLVYEIVDNSVDEALAGYCKNINVTIEEDNSITVQDDGRGIPVGQNHKAGKSALEVIFTVLHAGGKFETDGYKVSGGLHGVGSSVVNALSKWMEVTIKRDKEEHYIRFENGGHVAVPLKKIGTTNKTGTTVRFLPDDEIFTTTNFSFTTICERMQESAFLLKGITIEVVDEEDGRDAKYCYERGIEEFVEDLNHGKSTLHKVLAITGSKDNIEVDIAMQYTDTYQENIVSFVNNVKTVDGGSHEVGFKTALPLGINDLSVQLSIEKLLPTDSVSLFIPFTSKELMQKGGMYYGLNAVSHNLLLFNRLNSKNQNGLILGQPGSGKSFSAKREMINVFLTTKDDIYVIDPESEYAHMAQLLDGSVIHLEAGAKVYINPFDMDVQYGDEEGKSGTDPVKMKSDYICMLCESAMGGRYEITNIQKSIIDRVVIQLYKPYLKHMRELNDSSITCDTDASPTMEQFYSLLMDQPEPEAQNIALSLEIYCLGSFDTFAHKTNVDVNNRFTVYDIKDIGNGMKEMGLQVCLNHIWNKIIDNQKNNKRTWFYIDEFHILTKTRSSAEFLQQIWKRARKWGGIPTAITQNVEDLLNSEESRAIINNCEFIMMLSQSPIDRAALAEMYHISDAQLNYITNSPPGQGLIYNGEGIIPFIDKFPKDTKLYKIMSSKPGERLMAS